MTIVQYPSLLTPPSLQGVLCVLGLIILAGVYELFPAWNSIHIANAIMLLIGCWVFFIPESPYWLLANQGPEAAAQVLDKMAQLNGRDSILGFVKLIAPEKKLEEEGATTKESGNILNILRNPRYGFGFGIPSIGIAVFPTQQLDPVT